MLLDACCDSVGISIIGSGRVGLIVGGRGIVYGDVGLGDVCEVLVGSVHSK